MAKHQPKVSNVPPNYSQGVFFLLWSKGTLTRRCQRMLIITKSGNFAKISFFGPTSSELQDGKNTLYITNLWTSGVNASMAEWSKASDLSPDGESRVGSNPTACTGRFCSRASDVSPDGAHVGTFARLFF